LVVSVVGTKGRACVADEEIKRARKQRELLGSRSNLDEGVRGGDDKRSHLPPACFPQRSRVFVHGVDYTSRDLQRGETREVTRTLPRLQGGWTATAFRFSETREFGVIFSRRSSAIFAMRVSTALALVALVACATEFAVAKPSCDDSMTGFFDSDLKSNAWSDIARGNAVAVRHALAEDPCYALMRAGDGRGPLFWAHEFDNNEIIAALVDAGADQRATDTKGLTPGQMPKAPALTFPSADGEGEHYLDDDFDYADPYATRTGADHSEMR
jgi:hypothetical protein